MTTASNDRGRAYEYAWISILEEELGKKRPVEVVDNSSLEANKHAWLTMPTATQQTYLISAKSVIQQLMDIEPLMIEDPKDLLTLAFQNDSVGTQGDVRDIVMRRDSLNWEVGLSIKHNHEAVKHSRLSHRLDFGKEWFGVPCSNEYWNAVKPLFDWLKAERAKGTKWSEIPDKDTLVYVPLLNAFMDEVQRAYSIDKEIPRKMVEYLIGVYDYHKVISRDSKRVTELRSFNLHGTLSKGLESSGSAIDIPVTNLPSELKSLEFKPGSKNTVLMDLNNGWKLSFRIHNASSKVEPSLKFDVQFVSMPSSITIIKCAWK